MFIGNASLMNPTISGTITLKSPSTPASDQLGYCCIGTLAADTGITGSYKSYFYVPIVYPGVYLCHLNLQLQYYNGCTFDYSISTVNNNTDVSAHFTAFTNGSINLGYTRVLSVTASNSNIYVVASLNTGTVAMTNLSNLYVTRIA